MPLIRRPAKSGDGAGQSRRDYRAPIAFAVAVLLAGGGFVVATLPGRNVDAPVAAGPRPHPGAGFDGLASSSAHLRVDPSESTAVEQEMPVRDLAAQRAREVLRGARQLIRKKEYAGAVELLNGSRDTLKEFAETYVVLGQALEGQRDYAAARDFYNAAINHNPMLADAYWGYATASESLGDLPSALGAMRSYLHVEPTKDSYRLKVAQARSAIWEWESKLGRGAWGPTKGVPPGFTADELRRDGKGVGIKMPVPGTETSDGVSQAEVKVQDKFKLYKR